ncbi:MAG: hypothetical protein DIKNOCCD_00562 [bacterium]|nr:transposase [bacterium]MBE7489050.1 transposase [bacterium]MBK7497450.1 transposase [Candidatus Omnitrophota bacterium]MBV6480853.1 hypothetical protein [bacterium]
MAVRKYDQGFKEEAVRLLLTSGKQLKEIAEDLGIHPSTLRDWRNAYWALGSLSSVALFSQPTMESVL